MTVSFFRDDLNFIDYGHSSGVPAEMFSRN